MCNCFQEKTVNEIKARQFRKKKEIKARQAHEARTEGRSVPCAHLAATEAATEFNSRIIAS
jgi:hypothetical protein